MNSEENVQTVTLVNGHKGGLAALSDLGFQFGDGIFETMFSEDGQIPLKSFHYDRLLRSCARLNINVDAESINTQLAQALAQFVAGGGNIGKVKLTLTRGNGSVASYPPVPQPSNCYIQISPFKKNNISEPLALVVSPTPLVAHPMLAGIKHMNRLAYTMASIDVKCNTDQEILFCDTQGRIIETMRHNIFFVSNEEIHTPKLDVVGVAGVMRRVVMEKLSTLVGLPVNEVSINVGEMDSYHECFVSNALRGIVPVQKIDQQEYFSFSICQKMHHAMIQTDIRLCV